MMNASMRLIAGVMLCAAAVAVAQTAETIPFRAILLPTSGTGSGSATVLVQAVRDPAGIVVSAIAELRVRYTMPAGGRITSLRIQRANGPVAVDATPRGAAVPEAGVGVLKVQARVDGAATLLQDPASHEVVFAAGDATLRARLQRAEIAVALSVLEPDRVVPPVQDGKGTATAGIVAILTRDGSGRATSGEVFFDVGFAGFPENTLITGLHINAGRQGVNGTATIDSGLKGGALAVETATGAGRLIFEAEVNREDAGALRTLTDLADNPAAAYVNLHTIAHPDGAVRGQLRTADAVRFAVAGSGGLTLHSIRDAHGAVAAAVAIFSVHHAPGGVTSLYAGSPERGRLADAGAIGELHAGAVFAPALVEGQSADHLLWNPERSFLTLETGQGTVRVPLAPASDAKPVIDAVIAAVSDPALTTLAPGGLFTVFGTDLVKVPGDVGRSFDGSQLPIIFNGSSLTIGQYAAPLVTVTRDYIVAQAPVEIPAGDYGVMVRTPNGRSDFFYLKVAENAPGLYFDAEAGVFTTVAYQLAGRPSRPARKNELLWGYLTGLGRVEVLGSVEPPRTGRIVERVTTYRMTGVELLVDGRAAKASIVSSPGFAGLYQVLFGVPPETRSGVVDVQLKVRGAASNKVRLYVQ